MKARGSYRRGKHIILSGPVVRISIDTLMSRQAQPYFTLMGLAHRVWRNWPRTIALMLTNAKAREHIVHAERVHAIIAAVDTSRAVNFSSKTVS